jgi:N-hydroxyarylamine O-acetyltransferase
VDIPAYLQRIRYTGSLQPTLATLQGLHLAQLYAVPFENLDIPLGRPILLDEGHLFDKIVRRQRGGFCYELNGLFAALLSALGFEVAYLSAGVAHEDGTYGPEFDHLVLLIKTADDPNTAWLVDVGFGDSFRQPLQATSGAEQLQDRRAYRLEAQGEYTLLWQREAGGSPERQYRFTVQPRRFNDFEGMCRYHQTSPESSFTRQRICTLAVPGGRLTMADSRLIVTLDGRRTEREVSEGEEYERILRDLFGINLGDS